MMSEDEIKVRYCQSEYCGCGCKRAVSHYYIEGPSLLTVRTYDKETAEHLASAFNELESLKVKLAASKGRVRVLGDALKLIKEDSKQIGAPIFTLRTIGEDIDETLALIDRPDSEVTPSFGITDPR